MYWLLVGAYLWRGNVSSRSSYNSDLHLSRINCAVPLDPTYTRFTVLSTSRLKSKNMPWWMNILMIPLFLARCCRHKLSIHLITETSTTYFFCNPVILHERHKIDKKVRIRDFWLSRSGKAWWYCLWHSMPYPCCLVWRNIRVMDAVTLSNIPTLSVCLKELKVLLFDSPTQYYIFQLSFAAYHCYV